MGFTFKYFLRITLQLLTFSPLLCFSQPLKLKFKHITNEQGLSNSTIETIFQDNRGFIWFGTRDGLNRYDGHQMIVYRNNPKDSNSLSDNYIRCIYEDGEQRLWIGTINGLNQFDPARNNFARYKHDASRPASLSNNLVNCIYGDKEGNVWISTFGGGINLLQPGKTGFTHFRQQPGKDNTLSDDRVNYLYEDKKNNFWVGTESGLNLFDKKTWHFKSIRNVGDNHNAAGNNVIRIIQEDQQGHLWLGTEDNGLFLFDPTRSSFKQYSHEEKNASSLASNQVRSLLVDKSGKLWVGSINGGLDLFDPVTGSFFHYQNEPDNAASLSQRTVSALFEDKQENLWVGTHRGGVNLFNPYTDKFTLYRQTSSSQSLSYNDVKAFCEDSEGNIWIGTDGGGLNLFDPVKNSFSHYRYDPYDAKTIGSDAVLHVMEDSEHNLWVGTWGGGLNLLDRKTGRFTRFMNDALNKSSISSDYIQKIFEDSRHNLWIATYYGGLNLFDRKTRQFTRVTDDPLHQTRLSGNNIVSITEDKDQKIWIGTDDGGLNCYDPLQKRFTHYFNKEEKKPDLRVLFTDSKGRLWVGQTGLYLFDPAADLFSLYTAKAGLDNEFIKGITEDEQGNFWVATSNGLTKFNPGTLEYRKYNTGDGLQGIEFEANAYLKTKQGQMFFGGTNGFNSFYPDDIRINTFIPPVFLTDFQVFNQKIIPGIKGSPLENDISFTDAITLTYKQSTFSFGFAALNYAASENNQYAYKLEGWDKDWNYAGNEHKSSYTNLAPGEYVFRVKASNNDGVWNDEGATVRVIVTPPFWESWWFRILVVAVILGAAISFFYFKRKFDLRKLEEQKREEMHQEQLQFFTNISHEFRTPLSLIMGPLERLQKDNTASPSGHSYKLMYRNANRLLNLLNELMDFRKVESGGLKLKVMPGNLSLFLKEIAEEFGDLAIEKQLTFNVIIPAKLPETWFDRQVLEKIVINLISNSFKYTEDGGVITVEALTSLDEFEPSFENDLVVKSDYKAGKYIYIRVADNGIGISKESIRHLFERYYKITDSHLGSGIGLAFVKSLALLHKGHILVYSERNKGTEIIIGIPARKEDYEKTERWIKNQEEAGVRLESIPHKYEEHPVTADEAIVPGTGMTKTAHPAPHILLVEDNAELRTFLKDSLGPLYHISEAMDGQSGLIAAREVFPDLIISDVMMPVMDGIEFCRLIKEDIQTSHIPFIMLTAKDALESRIKGVESGADYYFGKPLSIDLLLLTIRNIFNQKQKQKERYTKEYHVEIKDLVHSAKDKAFMEQLLTIIESHLTNPDMDVDYICTQISMSRTKLYQKIKNITGQSIGEFIRTVRLKKAVEIMTHQDVPLTEVMYSVGIQTQSYFTKAFKKEFGKTPSQFIQELKK
jgi:ligand-binding sensor domain-containing protein/signal transduction histidine kinase/DNA-binding response OmpR family regulator